MRTAGARRGTRRQVLDEHIGVAEDAAAQGGVARVFDVEGQRLFAAIKLHEEAALAAR